MSFLHEREPIVREAEATISQAILDARDKHDLTIGEIVSILARELSSIAKYQIRGERHPDNPSKPGGLA